MYTLDESPVGEAEALVLGHVSVAGPVDVEFQDELALIWSWRLNKDSQP